MTARIYIAVGVLGAGLVWGCASEPRRTPPPEAQRPVLKNEAELAAERETRIERGEVAPATQPVRLAGEETQATPVARPLPKPVTPGPDAIEPDILLVNEHVLTLPEVLYPVRDQLAEMAATQRSSEELRQGFVPLLHSRVQQLIGGMLIYEEAMAQLGERPRAVIDHAITRRISERISREFGDSEARFERHLVENGLTLEKYRMLLERELVARQYMRERFLPKISVRRDELVTYYRRNISRYSTPASRELWMIEAPFSSFLPDGVSWGQAPAPVREQAREAAEAHIRQARRALAERSFEDAAREFSRGVHASQGGFWGEISKPLRGAYACSRFIFDAEQGDVSAPIETERGWVIVRCGEVTRAETTPFAEVQDEIREALTEQKYQRVSTEYLMRLGERATVSSLESFIATAAQHALDEVAPAEARAE